MNYILAVKFVYTCERILSVHIMEDMYLAIH